MYKCSFCDRHFKNVGAKVSHEAFCKSNPDFKPMEKFTCEFCGKEFVGKSGIHNHSKFCKLNPNKCARKDYVSTNTEYLSSADVNCKHCGKLCKNINSLIQHELRCKNNPNRIPINNFSKMYKSYSEKTKQSMVWNKGLTKEINESVHSYADKLTGRPHNYTHKIYHRTIEQRAKQSATRRQRIAEGLITPVTCNRFINSYIEYMDGKRKFLRSSYELIVAIFLDTCGIPFTYEKIRAPYYDEDGRLHTFLSDFCVGSIVLEIKGNYDPIKLEQQKRAFKNIGYELRVIHENEVFYIRDLLQEMFDIKSLLKEVKELSKNKNYYTYKLSF